MVFYAYVKNVNDDWSARYVVTFSSRSIADEWWRAVSTSKTEYADGVKRISPEYYTHDWPKLNAYNTINDPKVALSLRDNVIFQLMNDRDGRDMSIIPLQYFKDYVSGNAFFIRSKASPSEYWYCPGSTSGSNICVSRTERTRFRISERNGTGTIMIGSDDITITLASADLSVRVEDNSGQLVVSKNPESGWKFSDLLNGFSTGATLWDKNGTNEHVKELFRTVDGEEWELV